MELFRGVVVFVGRTVRSGVGVALRSGGEVVLGSRGSGSKLLALRYAQEVKFAWISRSNASLLQRCPGTGF